jgi:hypothetical protein
LQSAPRVNRKSFTKLLEKEGNRRRAAKQTKGKRKQCKSAKNKRMEQLCQPSD